MDRFIISLSLFVLLLSPFLRAHAQSQEDIEIKETLEDAIMQEEEGGISEEPVEPEPPVEGKLPAPMPIPPSPPPEVAPLPPPPPADEGVAGERRFVRISGVIIANYIYENSPNSFIAKYRFDLTGQMNADTAVANGDADFAAEVEGPFWKFPAGECKLEITIPKVPYEIAFKKTSDEKGDIRLVFKKPITEDWKSKCTFEDAPGAVFDTTGPPEKWLTRALDKAKPPLRSVVLNMKGNEETTTPLMIPKEIIGDPPLGSMEIEGTASVTVKPGTGE